MLMKSRQGPSLYTASIGGKLISDDMGRCKLHISFTVEILRTDPLIKIPELTTQLHKI
jgi:hypothetical protein